MFSAAQTVQSRPLLHKSNNLELDPPGLLLLSVDFFADVEHSVTYKSIARDGLWPNSTLMDQNSTPARSRLRITDVT